MIFCGQDPSYYGILRLYIHMILAINVPLSVTQYKPGRNPRTRISIAIQQDPSVRIRIRRGLCKIIMKINDARIVYGHLDRVWDIFRIFTYSLSTYIHLHYLYIHSSDTRIPGCGPYASAPLNHPGMTVARPWLLDWARTVYVTCLACTRAQIPRSDKHYT